MRNNSISGKGVDLIPGPDPEHQSVQPEDVSNTDTAYAATLPVLDDLDGAIRVCVAVNPRAHTPKAVSVLFASHQSTVTYHQFGSGIGCYDTKTDHSGSHNSRNEKQR